MIRIIYIIILVYFLAGAIGFYCINRKKEPQVARKNRIKLFIYFIIINVLFFSITIHPPVFRYLAILIIIAGFYEFYKLFRESGYMYKRFFASSIFIYALTAIGFLLFSNMDVGLMLFSFLILSIFDSFSQISGQLWGHRKLIPEISPQKTVEGLIGGILTGVLSAILLRELIPVSSVNAILLALGIMAFAFIGDVSTSYYKRKYNVKDFNNIIPGHGGFLDRFDSLIAGGGWVAITGYFINFMNLI